MSTRGRKILRSLCRKLVTDSRTLRHNSRHALKGSPTAKTKAVTLAQDYLAMMRRLEIRKRELPSNVHQVVADVRKNAGDIKLTCAVRAQALTTLMWVEGFPVRHSESETDLLLEQMLGVVREKPEVSLAELHKDELNRALAMLGGKDGN